MGRLLPDKKLAQRRWTFDAVQCLKRGGVCAGCIYENYFTLPDRCHMKNAILTLIRKVGKPPWFNGPTIIED